MARAWGCREGGLGFDSRLGLTHTFFHPYSLSLICSSVFFSSSIFVFHSISFFFFFLHFLFVNFPLLSPFSSFSPSLFSFCFKRAFESGWVGIHIHYGRDLLWKFLIFFPPSLFLSFSSICRSFRFIHLFKRVLLGGIMILSSFFFFLRKGEGTVFCI